MLKKINFITGGLLILLLFEGLVTWGAAFDFQKYSAISWIWQGLSVIFTTTLAIRMSNDSDKEEKNTSQK
jgi:hypothetical protein